MINNPMLMMAMRPPTPKVYAQWSAANSNGSASITGAQNQSVVLSNGQAKSNISKTSGVWYWELSDVNLNVSDRVAGIATSSSSVSVYTGADSYSWGYYSQGGYIAGGIILGTQTSYTAPGTVIGVEMDLDARTLQFYRNGTTTGASISITPAVAFFASVGVGLTTRGFTANFGASPFSRTVFPLGVNKGLF